MGIETRHRHPDLVRFGALTSVVEEVVETTEENVPIADDKLCGEGRFSLLVAAPRDIKIVQFHCVEAVKNADWDHVRPQTVKRLIRCVSGPCSCARQHRSAVPR